MKDFYLIIKIIINNNYLLYFWATSSVLDSLYNPCYSSQPSLQSRDYDLFFAYGRNLCVLSERLSNFPRDTEWVISRAGIWILDIVSPNPQHLRPADPQKEGEGTELESHPFSDITNC